jgi:uncharacterized protein HemX
MRKLLKRTEEALVRWLGSSKRSADRRAEGAARSVTSNERSLSGHSPLLRAPCRKDWLFVQKEALVSLARRAKRA